MRFRICCAAFPLVLSLSLSGCCSGPQCLDRHSGPDKERAGAPILRPTGEVINDFVSGPKEDRTDFRGVDLRTPGKLTIQLHWDNGKAKLQLHVFDVMGVQIGEGRVWGTGGLRCVIAVEEAGRYFARVRAEGEDDESTYSLRITFNPEGVGSPQKVECHGCVVGERKCLGKEGFIICEQKTPTCTVWYKPYTCPAGTQCEEGQCKEGGCNECSLGEKRCMGGLPHVCVKKEGCNHWVAESRCKGKTVCSQGPCVAKGAAPAPTPTPTPPKHDDGGFVNAKVISIYKLRDQQTLHIEIGENSGVAPGMTGYVLEGDSTKPLRGGDFKVTKVSGRFCIATTTLENLGKNHKVRINTR
jgi:hypothetical protein